MLPLFVWAQEKLSVADFYYNEKGTEAMLAETQRLDPNGQRCAIIKVVSTPPLKGLAFDTGQLQVMGVVEKTAETWVYVQQGIRKIQIQHPQLGSTEYKIPISIKPGRTYTMKLTGDMVQTLTFNDSKSQELVLHVSPSDAEVIINGTVENAQNGVIRKRLSFGTHRYIVRANEYYEQQGTVTINDPKLPQELSVSLKPKFGWLRFDNYYTMTDAKLYIDFKYHSNITDNAIRMGSGRHAIRIVKPLYETFEEEVNITDNDTTAVSPELVGNYGTASLTASSPETEIWIDNELKGNGKVDVNLGVGKHEVVCKRKSHRDTMQEITISKGKILDTSLPAPEPIYGALDIKASEEARFIIDDGDRSDPTSEFRSDKVLIGNHKIEVQKKGFKTETLYVDVEEGKTTEKSVNMLAIATVTFDSNPQGAQFYINGQNMSATPYTTDLETKREANITLESIDPEWVYSIPINITQAAAAPTLYRGALFSNFSADGETNDCTFSANFTPTIAYDGNESKWITATIEKSNNEGGNLPEYILHVTVKPNEETTRRTGYVLLQYNEKTIYKYEICQYAFSPNVSSISNTTLYIDKKGETRTITYKANFKPTIEYDNMKDWCDASIDTGNSTITVTVKPYSSNSSSRRYGYLYMMYKGKKVQTIDIYQYSY